MSARPALATSTTVEPINSAHDFHDEFFGPQITSRTELPDPRPLLSNLTRCVIEILAGAREIEQIARWVSEEVYQHLLKRVMLAERSRRARGAKPTRPAFSLGTLRSMEPCDGVLESVVIVHSRVRVRAVAIRLEGVDGRWRATAISVL